MRLVPLLALGALVAAAVPAGAVLDLGDVDAALAGTGPFTLVSTRSNTVVVIDVTGTPVKTWQMPPTWGPLDTELMPNGNLLVTAGGVHGMAKNVKAPFPAESAVLPAMTGAVFELDDASNVVWSITEADGQNFHWTHDADYLEATDTFLIADTTNAPEFEDRVIEVDRAGNVVWAYFPGQGSYPNDADRLPNGNTLVSLRDFSEVVEVDPSGTVVWSYGDGALAHQHNPDRLPNGNTIICDSDNDRIIEVDPDGNVVWSFGNSDTLFWPRDADVLPNGHILITDSRNNRVIEVTRAGHILWEAGFPWVAQIYEADRLNDAPVVAIHAPADDAFVAGPDVTFDVVVADPSLAGAVYALYDETAHVSLGPSEPLPSGLFDLKLTPGHSYRLDVTAWDEGGEGGGFPQDDSVALRTLASVRFTVT